MIIRSLSEVARMLDCTYTGQDIEIQGVSTDTRQINKGNLYVPLKGANFDGHDFVQQAVEAGAFAVLWEESREDIPENIPFIKVKDTLEALQLLASQYRKALKMKIIAITGSNGKTSTKDMLASVLATTYKTGKNSGNKNNHIGTPLTILEFDENMEMGVVEMGMSGFKEISLLTEIARPDIALITNIGEAHLADLGGSRDNIALAKLEILEGLKEGGLFIAHNENPLVADKLQKLQGISLSYGDQSGDFYPYDIETTQEGMAFRVNGLSEIFVVPLMGAHQVYNAVGAIVCALKLNVSEENIKKGLMEAEYTPRRGQIKKAGDHIVIDDTYKSNPASLKAAVDTLSGIPFNGKKLIVIGDMRDLGEEEYSLHEEIGAYILPDKIDYIVTVGKAARTVAKTAQSRYPKDRIWSFETKEEALDKVFAIMDSEKIMILAKGARVMQLEYIIDAVLKRYE